MYSGYIICKNGTYSVVHIRPAVNRVFIDVTCFLNLKEHCLISELSLQLGHLGTGLMSSFDFDEVDIVTTFNEIGIKCHGIFIGDVIKTRKQLGL